MPIAVIPCEVHANFVYVKVSVNGSGPMQFQLDTAAAVHIINWTQAQRLKLPFPDGVPGLEESNYYVDVQGVRMISINSNEKIQEQVAWLDKLLSASTARWMLITFHHPIFSTGKGRDNKELRDLYQPLFDKYGVDMVLTGHDHAYGRTNVVTGASVQTGLAGTVYVVSVSGPKMYEIDRKPNMPRVAQDTQLFQIIRIDGDRLTYESRTARGVLYDSFELCKHAGRPNRMISRVPKTSELIPVPAPTPPAK